MGRDTHKSDNIAEKTTAWFRHVDLKHPAMRLLFQMALRKRRERGDH